MAQSVKFSVLIQDVIKELSQVDGSGVQTYAEDRVAAKLQRMFDMVFREAWWPEYMEWYERTLDGTLGVATVNLTDIKDYKDVRVVFRDQSHRPIPEFPRDMNPYLVTGTTPRFIEEYSDTTKVFRVLPVTSTGKVHIHARKHPGDLSSDSDVLMDRHVLVLGATYDYLEDDGTNPNATGKFQNLFEGRLRQLKKDMSRKPIVLDPRIGVIPDRWYEL